MVPPGVSQDPPVPVDVARRGCDPRHGALTLEGVRVVSTSPRAAVPSPGVAPDRWLRITPSARIGLDELEWRVSRSGGPGGQHANTSDTRVEVSFDVAESPSLGPRQRARLLDRLGPVVRAVASDTRSRLATGRSRWSGSAPGSPTACGSSARGAPLARHERPRPSASTPSVGDPRPNGGEADRAQMSDLGQRPSWADDVSAMLSAP